MLASCAARSQARCVQHRERTRPTPLLTRFALVSIEIRPSAWQVTAHTRSVLYARSPGAIHAPRRTVTRLQQIGNTCAAKDSDFQQCLLHIVDGAIAFTGAAKGNVQLFDEEDGTLRL